MSSHKNLNNHLHPCLITSENMGEYAGIQRFISEFSRFALEKGFSLTLVSSKDSGFLVSTRFLKTIKDLENANFVSDKNDSKLFMTSLKSILLFVSSTFALIKTCRNYRPSVIHAQDAFFSGLSGVVASKVFGIPLLVHVHGPTPYFFLYASEASSLQKLLMRALAKIVTTNSAAVLVTDFYTRSLLKQLSPKKSYFCIPSPIATRYYKCSIKNRFSMKKTKHDLIFGFVGRLCKQKNLDILLEAAAIIDCKSKTSFSIVIVGEGPDIISLKQKTCNLGLQKKVLFTGRVDENRKRELLQSFDVFVLPSIYEGCSISLLEAMASGKALIASDIPSIRQIVQNNKEALLFDPYNPEELKDAIVKLVDNPDLIRILGNNAIEKIRLYDTEVIFPELLKLYSSYVS
jgi:glycosyltransferase involved in cell wall biosynthesis